MIQVLDYISELDAFVVNPQFSEIVDELGLTEWHEAVFIGRLLMLDNDYGEHIVVNWDEREQLAEKAKAMGIEHTDLMIVNPDRMQNGKDGPCNIPEIRKMFWTDVFKNLKVSFEFLFAKARQNAEGEIVFYQQQAGSHPIDVAGMIEELGFNPFEIEDTIKKISAKHRLLG